MPIVAHHLCQPKLDLFQVTTCFNFGMRINVLILRIVANFPQYDIFVRNWRHAHHACIPKLILKRDKASFTMTSVHEMVMKVILVEPRFAF